jgi:hypothetical protein
MDIYFDWTMEKREHAIQKEIRIFEVNQVS